MSPIDLVVSPILTEKVRVDRNELTQDKDVREFQFIIVKRIPLCPTSSKALEMSKKNIPTLQPLFRHSFVLVKGRRDCRQCAFAGGSRIVRRRGVFLILLGCKA